MQTFKRMVLLLVFIGSSDDVIFIETVQIPKRRALQQSFQGYIVTVLLSLILDSS